MNTRMWAHPATQANVATLRARGVELVGPEEGELAEGEVGVGRMGEPEEIARAVEELLGPRGTALAGKRVLVTAGGTREPLDAVRFLGNRSSGRMGVALAAEARRRGARRDAARGEPRRAGARTASRSWRRRPPPTSSARRWRAPARPTSSSWPPRSPTTGPAKPLEGKRAEGPTSRGTCELEPTADVLARARPSSERTARCSSASAPRRRGRARASARSSTDKNVDLVVYNDVSAPTSASTRPTTRSSLVTRDGERRVRRRRRTQIAAGDRSTRSSACCEEADVESASRIAAAVAAVGGGARARRRRTSRASCTRRRRRCGSACSASSPRGT